MNSSFCRKSAIRSSSRYCFHRRSCSREPWPRGMSPRGTGCRQPWEPWGGKHGTGWVVVSGVPAAAPRAELSLLPLCYATAPSAPMATDCCSPEGSLPPLPHSPGHCPAKGTKGDRAPLPLPLGKGGRAEGMDIPRVKRLELLLQSTGWHRLLTLNHGVVPRQNLVWR